MYHIKIFKLKFDSFFKTTAFYIVCSKENKDVEDKCRLLTLRT